MGYDVAKGEEFERKAEKKIKGWGMFGSKYEDAADLYQKAANSYKLSKSWDRAASAYIKLASCNLKSDSKHEAATAYVDSANCYKKISPKQAISCLDQAVNLLLEINRLNMAAKYCKDIGDLCEQEKNMDQAITYFERAADLYQIEEANTTSSQCRQKVAEFSAQLGKYHTAAEIYEQVAGYALSNNLLKYGARGHLLNAGICQLCKGDIVAINNALERYQDLDPTFSRTRECRLLSNLAVAFDEEDAAKFTIAVKEFDSITKLDSWKTTLLLRVKEHIKEKELEEDDLT
ncbi:alpha-soluble NSF attachment protein-like [Salvia hispanica]|uniref:alpha-soluble NSF attachment protein-like n=1 Tax=Salvia hispanica TaxID=49212 RepID=UPI0020090F33|nr:alpha-soluble NSF attachment protein-like [Salvia hispanica]